jgi:hypothetical protein
MIKTTMSMYLRIAGMKDIYIMDEKHDKSTGGIF